MSIEANSEIIINPITGDIKLSGGFKYQFSQPLILKNCEHQLQTKERRNIFRKQEIWKITTHGQKNGECKVTSHCMKLD